MECMIALLQNYFSDSSDDSISTIESTSSIPALRRSKRDSNCPIRYGHGLSYQHTDGSFCSTFA